MEPATHSPIVPIPPDVEAFMPPVTREGVLGDVVFDATNAAASIHAALVLATLCEQAGDVSGAWVWAMLARTLAVEPALVAITTSREEELATLLADSCSK